MLFLSSCYVLNALQDTIVTLQRPKTGFTSYEKKLKGFQYGAALDDALEVR